MASDTLTVDDLRVAFEKFQSEGLRLAGGLNDLSQRAAVYHHVFRESGGNHIFPLIAAHGALWARGWFGFGAKLGRVLSWQYAFNTRTRLEKLAQLADFANAFRDINRRVCVDVYANYYFTKQFGEHPHAAKIVPTDVLNALNRIHNANCSGIELTDDERREIFTVHFLSEQQHIVGPTIEKAIAEFDWPLLRSLALRPVIRFAYFRRRFLFRNFANKEERIEKGLVAFNMAADLGWENVEQALREYDVLPERFFAKPVEYFTSLREAILASPAHG
ncbi:MAG: hypothetical protein HQ518_05830 [Rhodopirellula sp.]|nr:hypothetical protein [Rhodopirellula sp.]